ncbi:transcription initiation factor IIA subunit 1-like isoform X1 [Populus alba x Populus x berolinensis]|nr:transcription initiation factor IIA subunit 1-like isoform X1 [Populus alba x Populus x berolinensis]
MADATSPVYITSSKTSSTRSATSSSITVGQLWETKMMQAVAICGTMERSSANKLPVPGGPITPVHDLNVPYEGTEEYETPTAEMLFPPTPMQTPMQTPLPGSAQTPLPGNAQTPLPGSVDNSSMYNIPTGSSDYPTPVSDAGAVPMEKLGDPALSCNLPLGCIKGHLLVLIVLTNKCCAFVAYVEGRDEVDRGTSSPSLDNRTSSCLLENGSARILLRNITMVDSYPSKMELGILHLRFLSMGILNRIVAQPMALTLGFSIKLVNEIVTYGYKGLKIILNDRTNIYNYQGVANEDYNIANTPAPNDLLASTPAVVSQNDVADDDDDDEPLNEDDDDDEDLDDVDQGEELNTQHLVLAQFDKVTRTKSKWKCILKDGIMHINNKDILFNKETAFQKDRHDSNIVRK